MKQLLAKDLNGIGGGFGPTGFHSNQNSHSQQQGGIGENVLAGLIVEAIKAISHIVYESFFKKSPEKDNKDPSGRYGFSMGPIV